MTENNRKKTAGRPFRPGQSGNPAGRPRGSRNHASLILEKMLDGEVKDIGRTVIGKALEGDPICLKLCVERLLPAKRERRAQFDFDMPDVRDAAGVSAAFVSLIKAVGDGHLEVSQAEGLARILEAQKRTIETAELEARIAALEERAANNGTTTK